MSEGLLSSGWSRSADGSQTSGYRLRNVTITTGTDPLLLRYVMDFLDRLKGRVVPSAVPWTSGLLNPAAFLTRSIVFASSGLDRLALLRLGAKVELAERRHLFCDCANLAFEFARPYPQRRILRLEASIIASEASHLCPPVRCLGRRCTLHDYK